MFAYDNVLTGAFLSINDASFYQIIGWVYIALILCLLLVTFLRHKKLISEKYEKIAEICIHGFAYFGIAITYFDYGGDSYMKKKHEKNMKNRRRY